MYPIGAIFETEDDDFNPNNYFEGTWEKIKDRFLFSTGDTYTTSGLTGGEFSHTLTRSELPNYVVSLGAVSWAGGHNGNIALANSQNTYCQNAWQGERDISLGGGGQAHNNMPPFITVNMWKRIS